MLKDRIVEVGSRRVLLPESCSGPSGSVSVNELRAILASDRHSLLVTGETGTGKEMIADCVFQVTKRLGRRCLKINCAGLDRNLVGSELFGHKKGAYTGADEAREGVLKSCDGSVLFLDEVGWLPEDLQARLLRFMEDGKIRPLGADRDEPKDVDVRIVAATNKDANDPKVMIPDLRQRFDFELKLPALSERGGDVLWFLCEPGFLGDEEEFTGITLRTLLGMISCVWTGNIRELKKYCLRKTLLRRGEELFGEERHILDDWTLGGKQFLELSAEFAGFVLAAAEGQCKRDTHLRDDADVRRVLALLVGLHSGMNSGLFFRQPKSVAIVPIGFLRDAVGGCLSGLGRFDLEVVTHWLAMEYGGLDLHVFTQVDPIAFPGVVDFGGALVVLARFVRAFESVDSSLKERISTVNGRLKKCPVRPSLEFIESIGYAGPDGILFATPKGPSAEGGIEVILDGLKISDRDRDICLLCKEGLSNVAIGKRLKCGTSTVADVLVKMRGHAALLPYLPKHQAGRKPKSI